MRLRTFQESFLLPVCTCLLFTALYVPSCDSDRTEVIFYRAEGYTFSRSEQRAIQTISKAAARDARSLLSDLPPRIIIRVNPGRKVMDDLGSASGHSSPNVINWTVDPSHPAGVGGIARTHLRATLLFHCLQLSRLTHRSDVTLMDQVVSMGMAAVFERDAGGRTYPWAQYPDDVAAWVTELLALPASANLSDWMYRHPDGRRWVGIRAGAYLVDRAMKASGKSAAQLVSVPTSEIVRLGR